MKTNEMMMSIVAVSVAVVIFSLVLMPMVENAANETKNGDEITGTNTPTAYLALADETITVSMTELGVVTSSYTSIYTSGFVATIVTGDSGTVSITMADGTSNDFLAATEQTMTINPTTGAVSIKGVESTVIANQVYVNGTSTDAYGIFTPAENSEVNVKSTQSVMLLGSTHIAVQTVTATGNDFTVTSAQAVDSEDEPMKGILMVSDVAEGDTTEKSMIAPVEYTYYEQIPIMDENLKTILEVIPYLVIIGVLLASVGMFISKRY